MRPGRCPFDSFSLAFPAHQSGWYISLPRYVTMGKSGRASRKCVEEKVRAGSLLGVWVLRYAGRRQSKSEAGNHEKVKHPVFYGIYVGGVIAFPLHGRLQPDEFPSP